MSKEIAMQLYVEELQEVRTCMTSVQWDLVNSLEEDIVYRNSLQPPLCKRLVAVNPSNQVMPRCTFVSMGIWLS